LKKLYTEEDYKRRQKKRANDELAKIHAETRKGRVKRTPVPKYKIADRLRSKENRHIIRMPNIFSVVDNTADTLEIFDQIFEKISSGHKMFLDMRNIEILTPDAPLYMLAIFEYFYLQKFAMDITGNFPKNEQINELLIQSRFFEHVTLAPELKVPKYDENILQIESGIRTDSLVVKEVIKFALRHLGQEISPKSRTIFRILIEMMDNTVEHAYKVASDRSKWYLMACRDKTNGQIRFAFLDGGLGVPATIRKNFKEKVLELFVTITGDINDARLIMSALQGIFRRTRTKLRNRGKGLPNIYKSYNEKFIDNLRIISNVGYIDKGSEIILKDKFHGTLYTWDFI
jgi:hypothetical protein